MTRTRTTLALTPSLFLFCLAGALTTGDTAGAKVTAGEYVQHALETPHPYSSSGEASPALSWKDEIFHEGATYIAVHFERFHLADGDYLVLRSPDGKQSWTYTGLGKAGRGEDPGGFFAVHLKGDTVQIELYTVGAEGHYGFKVDYYGRGYNNAEIVAFWAAGLGEKMNLPAPPGTDESICTADDTLEAKCYQASEPTAYDESRAVARLLLNGGAWCTGWLIGCEGHVMTNEHCIGSQGQLDDIDFEFMAEGADCATDCSSGLACPGTIEASGGTLIQVDAALDFALVLPDTTVGGGTDLNASYGYMQLRPTGAALGERIYIPQHPAGWGKRLAMESTYPADADGLTRVASLTETACSGGTADVGYWADTQGGSSGSPVLGYSDNKVVALHHCRGSAFCASGNPGSDDPNRGVPIEDIIADLGGNVPNCAACDPPPVPAGVAATPNGDNRIDVSWSASAGATSYNVFREIVGSRGAVCPGSAGELIASGVVGTSYSDTTVSGGTTYAYTVAAVDDAEPCESAGSTCDTATATGLCTRAPDFDGIETLTNDQGTDCSVSLSWSAATEHCGSDVVYNVYRSDTASFAEGAGSLIASCLTGTSHQDTTIPSGEERFYQVRAEDDSGNGSGACAGGNEDTNAAELSVVATGPNATAFSDDVESGVGNWTTAAGAADTGTSPWSIVTTDANSPVSSWFVTDEAVVKDQFLVSKSFSLPAGGGVLSFWHQHDTETGFDGGVLEYSTDGGGTWFDILEGNADRFLMGGYGATISTSFSSPIGGRPAWHGSNGSFEEVQVDLSDFGGTTVDFRWRFACDTSVSGVGWWVDDFEIFEATECGCEALTDVSNQVIADTQSFIACQTLYAEDFTVMGPGGNVTFTGNPVELGDGFEVDADAAFAAGN